MSNLNWDDDNPLYQFRVDSPVAKVTGFPLEVTGHSPLVFAQNLLPNDEIPIDVMKNPANIRRFGEEVEWRAGKVWELFTNDYVVKTPYVYSSIDYVVVGSGPNPLHFLETKGKCFKSNKFPDYQIETHSYDKLVNLNALTGIPIYLLVVYTDKMGYVELPIRAARKEEVSAANDAKGRMFHIPYTYITWLPDDLHETYFQNGWFHNIGLEWK